MRAAYGLALRLFLGALCVALAFVSVTRGPILCALRPIFGVFLLALCVLMLTLAAPAQAQSPGGTTGSGPAAGSQESSPPYDEAEAPALKAYEEVIARAFAKAALAQDSELEKK